MAIPDSFIDELVGRTDIAELAGGYVRFAKRSGGNLFGLCPFHSEKTPSFSVNSDKQIYYCFGCGKGGGAISFAMEIEHLTFPDAVEFLAKRAGMTVPDDTGSQETALRRKRMLEINREAARFFHRTLISGKASAARDYLAGRGISKAMVTRFGIGAAPEGWTALTDELGKAGYTPQELIEAGLARSGKDGRNVYDLFRNRLVFPVINVRGEVIGFTARVLGAGEPKYINSPDSPVFSKSGNLFALNLAKKSKSGILILVEGSMDVIALHQAGFDSAVASLGTSLTAEQTRLMARYTENVVLAYDADGAGQKAASRASALLDKAGLNIKVVNLQGAKDPDEYVKKHGADAFKILIEQGRSRIEHMLFEIEGGADLTADEGRIAYLGAATDVLAEIGSTPQREIYGARVAERAGVSAESIENEVNKKLRISRAKQKKELNKRALHPAAAGAARTERRKSAGGYAAAAEEGLVGALIREPSLMAVVSEMGFSREEFTMPVPAEVFRLIGDRISEGREISEALILSELSGASASGITGILQKTGTARPDAAIVRDCIERIRTDKYKSGAPDSELLLEIKAYKEKKISAGD